jgi:electron transfer flavoprotein beta subunit
MNLIVCIKHVPATDTKIKIAPDGKSIDPAGVNWVISPYDEYAIEAALRLREKAGSGEVTVVSLGGDAAKESLRKALAMGCDKAALVSDPALAGSDALGTARALAKAVSTVPYDLLFFGQQGVGEDQSQVGVMVAEILGLPHVSMAVKLELRDGAVHAEREIEGGHEVVECPCPAVVTAQKGLNEPRYPSLKGIMAAKKKDIAIWNLSGIQCPVEEVGERGARVRTVKLELPPPKQPGKILGGDPKEAARELARILREERKLI